MNVIVEIQGWDELNARLVKIANGSMEAMRQGAYKTMSRVERMAKQLCPTDTGNLKTSIHAGTYDDGAYASAGGGGGLSDIKYAPYVEYGTGIYATKGTGAKKIPWVYKSAKYGFITTSGNPAQPFFIPAVESAMPFAEADMKEAVDRLIEAT